MSTMDSRNAVIILYVSAFIGSLLIVTFNETMPNFLKYCTSKVETYVTKPVTVYIKQILYPRDSIHSDPANSKDYVPEEPEEHETLEDNERSAPDVLPPITIESSSLCKIHHLSSLLPQFRVDMESIDLRTQDSKEVHEFFKFFCAVTIIKIYMDHITKTQDIFMQGMMNDDNKHTPVYNEEDLEPVLRGFKAIENLRTLNLHAETFAESISDAQFTFSDNEYLKFLRNIKKLTFKFQLPEEILQRAAMTWNLPSKVMNAVNQVIWAYGDATLEWKWVDKEKGTVIPLASPERCQQVPQLETFHDINA